MEKKTLEILFTGKLFWIPDYQRDYAWRSKNVTDLFDDLRESIETNTRHYIGTFILSKVTLTVAESIVSAVWQGATADQANPNEDAARRSATTKIYALVDGQQRLTTLSMILHTLVAELPSDDDDRVVYERRFLRSYSVPHLLLQSNNRDFYTRLLQNSTSVVPMTRGQRLLKQAHADIKRHVQSLIKNGSEKIRFWLEAIKDLEILEFIEEDEGRAIRIFQTVNDRGVPLTNMEKAKSLLVYYSNRFLEGKLDHEINECFGGAYRSYDAIKELVEAEEYSVDLINRPTFNEDSILRWQFVSRKSDKWIFDATEQYVLEHCLNPSLKERRENRDSLQNFIEAYITDVRRFFSNLRNTLQRMKTEPEYYKLFVLLGPSTYLFPLIVRLAERKLLDQQALVQPQCTFRSLIETADVRVYKTRGTDPQRDITTLARDVEGMTPQEIATRLRDVIKRWMADAEFETRLRQDVYGNRALVRVLVALDEHLLRKRGTKPYSLEELIGVKKTEPTIEHVFSQEPVFDFPGHQFQSADEYRQHNDKLGNLLILEKRLNSRCNNRTVEDKINKSDLYAESKFECVQQFRQDCHANGPFTVAELDKRTEKMMKFCLSEWPI